MPILSVKETNTSKGAAWSVSGGRTYSLEVRVVTNDPTIGPRAAMMACNVNVGDTYRFPLASPTEFDYGACLSSISADTEGEDNCSYIVKLEYGPFNPIEVAGAQSGDNTWVVNPVAAAPVVKWSSIDEERACILDRNAAPILNSAGDPFDPPLKKVESIPVVTITRTLAAFDPGWIAQFKNKTNKDEWMGWPAGTVLCKDISGDKFHDPDFSWLWSQSITLAFKPIITADEPNPDAPWETDTTIISAGWAEQVLNAGLRQLNSDGDKVEQILIDGSPTSSPVFLTPDGKFDPTTDPNYLVFDIYEEEDFSLFDLPEDLFSAEGSGSPAGGS